MKIWLDLANSPQVLFFRPIIQHLETAGHQIVITARSYAQTVELSQKYGLTFVTIGVHGGKSLKGLLAQTYLRATELARWAKNQSFDLALSHNSYSQVIAARMRRLPAVTLMDYEHQPLNHLCFRLAKRVIVPTPFPEDMLRKFGAAKKFVRYPGIKEQVYLHDFEPEANFRQANNLPTDQRLIVVRPPATWAAYHRFENDIFDQLLIHLNRNENAFTLFLPRLPSQIDSVKSLSNIKIANGVYDGPNLLYHSDIVISGGGTMNREAAVLGSSTFTVFKGKSAAVDRYLIEQGRMFQISSIADIEMLAQHVPQRNPRMASANIIPTITAQILASS